MAFLQPFEDGQALGQWLTRAAFQGRHSPGGIELAELGQILLAFDQVMGLLFECDSLQIQGDAHAVGCKGQLEGMKDQHRDSLC